MAEARNAVLVMTNKRGVGLRLNSTDEDDGWDVTIHVPHPLHMVRRMYKAVARTRNRVMDMLFPANPLVLAVVMAIVVGVVLSADPQSWFRQGFLAQGLWWMDSKVNVFKLPRLVRVGILAAEAAVVGFIMLMAAQRLLLRILLSWRGWMYLPHGQKSILVTVWGASVQLLSGRHPQLYSFQGALPRQHVPSVKQTCSRYLETVRPLLSDDEMAEVEAEMKEFVTKQAPKLQWYLVAKSWWAPHYVTDWWEKFVYHRGRDSIMINSNYYILDSAAGCPTTIQAARAASLVRQLALFKRQIDHESVKPLVLRGTVPLCMNQYRRLFGTTRIPNREIDVLQQSTWSKHVAVLCRGHWFKLDLYRSGKHGGLLAAPHLEQQFAAIQRMATELPPPSEAEAHLPALTAGERTRWANAREQHLSEGINRASLDVIEKAIMVVVLDQERPVTWEGQGHSLLHGSGSNRWFDKSLTLVCYANGRAGLNVEHSWADAPVPAHAWESAVTSELLPGGVYDEDGHTKHEDPAAATTATPPRTQPVRLQWDLSAAVCADITAARTEAMQAIQDLQLQVFRHDAYGKGFMKSRRISPDAYIQAALQLAYYRDAGGEFALTYESSMTRLYRHGRTETVRSVSQESCAFVRAMEAGAGDGAGAGAGGSAGAGSATTASEKVALLRAATDIHQTKYRDAMSGRGVDRHLFALYVVSKGRDMNCPFLNRALSMPWKLSTSQQPQQQTTKWRAVKSQLKSGGVGWWSDKSGDKLAGGPTLMDLYSPGGGFGPVAQDGYGVSYMVVGEDAVYFHVSSKKSSPATDSDRFRDNILKAFADIRTLFEAADADE